MDGVAIAVEDLPGTYSLDPISPDEQVVTDLLTGKYPDIDRPDAVVVRSFTSGDLDALRDGVRASMAPILEGRFLPRPGPWCNECPALDLLCAGPALPS